MFFSVIFIAQADVKWNIDAYCNAVTAGVCNFGWTDTSLCVILSKTNMCHTLIHLSEVIDGNYVACSKHYINVVCVFVVLQDCC